MEPTTSTADPTQPVLDEDARSFVRRSMSTGLVQLEELKKVVKSLMAESDNFTPKRLAEGLMGAGILTQWQANKLLAGKSKGFYLGSYRLLRPIGKGGMGMVYLGEHHVMKRLMALKILPPEATGNQRRLDRFKEEARACAQLDHPNIVRAYDFAEAGGKFYIVMEYVDGVDLHHAVARDGTMSTAEAIDAIVQSARGLAHAHERGIIHRDIKPSNLLMRTDGVIKVSDLGLARVGLSEVSDAENQRLMGTADFVAPEQAINSRTVDARADIYSLGCTFYYLLTGQAPYDGQDVAQRLARHQTAKIPDVRTHRSDCPAKIAELIRRMMAKRPDDRPKSVTELITQLKRLHGSSLDKPNGMQRPITPASETEIDDSVYQATIDDTSLSADGEVDLGSGLDEIDLSNLPAMESVPVATFKSAATAAHGNGRVAGQSRVAGGASGSTNAGTAGLAGNQAVLLGVGLTVAVLALVAVLGMAYINLTKPIQENMPKIKATEDGKEITIIQ